MKLSLKELRSHIRTELLTEKTVADISAKLQDNVDFINQYLEDSVDASSTDPSIKNLLSTFTIDDSIGSGNEGAVFSFSDSDFVIKVTDPASAYDGGKSEKSRMKKIADQIWSGKNVSGKMHFFDVGKLGKNTSGGQVFCILMPKLVPFNSTYIYDKNEIFFENVMEVLYDAISWEALQQKATWDQIKNECINLFSDNTKRERNQDEVFIHAKKEKFDKELDIFKPWVMAIFSAMISATKEGGSDLHSGNLGFFPQQPEKLFFFDI